uniref:unspecific monooxygenase n=1 Tax=Zygaena filipendulae TaxID=287375 RepID=A0A286MXN8_9NEOP|nr:cytochrome P450 CYP337B11 [Zygaena filipendulae]
MLFYILVILCLTLYYILKYFKKNKNYWKKRNVVQADDSLRKFIIGNRSLAEIYKEIYDDHPNEPFVGTFIGSKPALLLRNLENIKTVLAGDFESFHSRGIVTNPKDILADNLLFMDDYKKWKLLRQKFSPVFTSARLKTMFHLIERCARDFQEMVKDNPEMRQTPFNALYTYTTASLGASVFGIDANSSSTMQSPFLHMTRKAVLPSLNANIRFFLSNSFPTLFRFFNMKAFGEFEQFFVGVVKNVLNFRRTTNQRPNDFIDVCLNLQDSGVLRDSSTGYSIILSDELVSAQAFFFFLAGVDTSANAMHFTLIELAHNPDILRAVHAEIDEVFQECNEEVTFDVLEKMKYLDKVLDESLRIYPPIGSLQRKCVRDTILPVGNIKIERDTLVIIPVYALHTDKRYYADPELFDPNRFDSIDVKSKQNKMTYMPFGEGNRICLGARYARLQVKAGLGWLLRRFTLTPLSPPPKRFEKSFFSIRSTEIQYYKLVPRN